MYRISQYHFKKRRRRVRSQITKSSFCRTRSVTRGYTWKGCISFIQKHDKISIWRFLLYRYVAHLSMYRICIIEVFKSGLSNRNFFIWDFNNKSRTKHFTTDHLYYCILKKNILNPISARLCGCCSGSRLMVKIFNFASFIHFVLI